MIGKGRSVDELRFEFVPGGSRSSSSRCIRWADPGPVVGVDETAREYFFAGAAPTMLGSGDGDNYRRGHDRGEQHCFSLCLQPF